MWKFRFSWWCVLNIAVLWDITRCSLAGWNIATFCRIFYRHYYNPLKRCFSFTKLYCDVLQQGDILSVQVACPWHIKQKFPHINNKIRKIRHSRFDNKCEGKLFFCMVQAYRNTETLELRYRRQKTILSCIPQVT